MKTFFKYEKVSDFTVTTVSMNWDDWHKLSTEVQKLIDTYGTDHRHTNGGKTYTFEISTPRLNEILSESDL